MSGEPGYINVWFCPACGEWMAGRSYSVDEARKRCTKTIHRAIAQPRKYVPAPQHPQVGEAELDDLERWMVDYEGEEGDPVETTLSWITGPDGDPTTKRPDVGDYLVRLRDVRRLLAEHPLDSEGER